MPLQKWYSKNMDLNTSLSTLTSIKKTFLPKLDRLGLFTIEDLLLHIPTRYEDYSKIVSIESLTTDSTVSVVGTVSDIKSNRSWQRKLLITTAILSDDSGSIRLLWFNQSFITKSLKENSVIRVSGKVTKDKQGLVFQSPSFEPITKEATHTGRLVPIYPETAGLTSKFIRWQIKIIFEKLREFPDPLPDEMLKRLSLPSLKRTFFYLHFPKDETEVLLAKKRLAFQEMFFVQIKALQTKHLYESQAATPFTFTTHATKVFLKALPFELTKGQVNAMSDISKDLSQPSPMNRLLNGDVGSGKTVVAAYALYMASKNNLQGALLAPTEVLAEQHYQSLKKLLSPLGVEVALYTRNYHILHDQDVTKKSFLSALAAGIPDVIIGTHALLQEGVQFKDLGLVIVDEQHRFGVAQRAKLQDLSSKEEGTSKNTIPHFLSLTATPIPRTLTLTFFGNLSVSLLDEAPKNRLPIITKLAKNNADRSAIYNHIKKELAKGRQAFIIFPLVEESLVMKEVKAAVSEHQRLAEEVFPDARVGIIHGKLKATEKEAVMKKFTEQEYDILVATAVIEVGIDIPNATVILIEEAERFGLSQLHQFRGRVGRGVHQSYCFLIPGNLTAESKRLEALTQTTSGFALAEIDLELRGPGSFLGNRQSGMPDFAMENMTNIKLVTIAQKEAKAILEQNPSLTNYPFMLSALQRFEERIHLE